MEEEGCRGTVGREIVEDKESEGVGEGDGEGPPIREEGRNVEYFYKEVMGRCKSEERQTKRKNKPHKLVHSDTLCIRTKTDCSATHLFISFIYLLKMDTERFK